MFGIDLYPTTKDLISRLAEGIEWTLISSALEPSAGTGNIALWLKNINQHSRWARSMDLDCIEIDPTLQSTLKGYELRVVHDDFLTYETYKRYDLIIGNPPFSDGDRHLLKALEMQKHGGKIRFLLNAETIRNPYTNTRKDLARKLAEYGASIEFIEGAFKDAERKTGVEVALIKVDIPRTLGDSVILEGLRRAQEAQQSAAAPTGEIVHADYIRAVVDQYNFEAKAGISIINEYCKMIPHMLVSKDENENTPILHLKIGKYSESTDADVNGFIKQLRAKYWRALLANRKFTGVLTSDLEHQYLDKIKELVDFEFSLFNIYAMALEFHKLAIGGVEKAIIELFDTLSRKNSYHEELDSENIHYYNGWKTNKAWKINHKVIRPMYALEKDWAGSFRMSIRRAALQELADMEKVFSYLDGKPLSDSGIYAVVERAVQRGQTRNIETTYFNVTLFKKGTCHIKFTNPDLLAKFNIYGSQQKKWLPPSYGRAAYTEMTPEEQSVVDSFEGAAEYQKRMDRREFFLAAPAPLMIGAIA